MKKALIIIGILLIVGTVGYLLYQRTQNNRTAQTAAMSLETTTLKIGVLESTISATGNVQSAQSAILSWQTSGIVENVNVKVGDIVEKGEKLATLATTSLPQAVILAQSDLYEAEQELLDLTTTADDERIQAMSDIVTYEQAVRDSQYTLDNFTIPTNQKGMDTVEAVKVMKERLDKARQAFEPYKYFPADNSTREARKESMDLAQADYNAAVKRLQYEYDLEVAQSNLSKAQQAYDKWKVGPDPAEVEAMKAKIAAAEATQHQIFIEAPFSGAITQVNTKVGDKAASGIEAFRLDDLSALFVDLEVSEVDIDQITVGQPVSVTFDALRGVIYAGSVVDVALISEAIDSVVNYTVTVALSDADSKVRPGMTAEVEIIVSRGQEALLIPNQAVRSENGEQVVYLLQPGRGPVPVTVTLGASSDTFSELLTGDLQAGDMVILNPADTANEQNFRGMPLFFRAGSPPTGSRNRDNQQGGSSGGQQERPAP